MVVSEKGKVGKTNNSSDDQTVLKSIPRRKQVHHRNGKRWKKRRKRSASNLSGFPSTTFSHTISLENSAKLFTGRPALLSVKYKSARIEPVGWARKEEDAVVPKICPKCRSRRVNLWLGRGGGQMYKCPDCGYYGAAVVEFDDDTLRKLERAERMRRKLRARRKEKPPK